MPGCRLLLTLALTLVSALALARGGLPSNNPTLNAGITCTAYLGLGDVQPGATYYVGMRAYTLALALAGAKVFNIRRASDGVTEDVNLACNGLPNTAQTIPFCLSTTCTITKFYDQTSNGWDVSQGTVGSQGVLTLVCINGNPCVGPSGGYTSAARGLTFNNPDTLWVIENGFNSANNGAGMASCTDGSGNGEQLYSKNFGGTTNTFVAQSFTGGLIQAGTAVSGVFQDKLGVFNGASSALYVNGAAAVTGSLTAENCTSASGSSFSVGGMAASTSSLLESAGYASDVSGSYAAMRANARVVWNY